MTTQLPMNLLIILRKFLKICTIMKIFILVQPLTFILNSLYTLNLIMFNLCLMIIIMKFALLKKFMTILPSILFMKMFMKIILEVH